MEKFDVDALMKAAMKAKDQHTLQLLRSVKAKILLIKTSSTRKTEGDITEQEAQDCIRKEIQELQEHLASAKQKLESMAKDAPSAEKEVYQKQYEDDQKAIAYLTPFLPQNISDTEVEKMIMDLVGQGKKMPEIMKHFSSNFKGRVDMKKVSELAKAKAS